ncbi:MAG: hypothetical protein IKI84_06830 [Clostridia bacterium]|nr:hypothetical protein [Clostridia bacterium]
MNIRTGRYQNTGVAAAGSNLRFGIGDAAYLPDSEAGTDLAGCFRADANVQRRHRQETRTVSFKTAVVAVAIVLFVCSCVTISRFMAVKSMEDRVNDIVARMDETRRDNVVLRRQVAEVRDLSRIGIIAVTRLKMVASDESNTVEIKVLQVENFAGSVEKDAVEEAVYVSDGTGPIVMESGRAGR